MIDAKQFRALNVFVHGTEVSLRTSKAAGHEAMDPAPTQWKQMGFVTLDDDGEYHRAIDTDATLLCLQLSERILPGPVIREHMAKYILDLEEREGRKVGKKQYAEIKEEVIHTLLPKAFIKRKLIPIIITSDLTYIFTGSAKVTDDVVSYLIGTIDYHDTAPSRWVDNVQGVPRAKMTAMAKDDGELFGNLEPDNTAVLKGSGKKTIAIKDKKVGDVDIQQLLKQDYEVTQLGMEFFEDAQTDTAATFKLNEHLVISSLKLLDVKDDPEDKGTHGLTVAWLVVQMLRKITDAVTEMMGGMKPKAGTTATPDDDPL